MFSNYIKQIGIWLLIFVVLTAVSFLTYVYPETRNVATVLLVALFVIASLKDMRYGLLGIIMELLLGVQGYLFALSYGDVVVPLRMILFIVWLSFWIGTYTVTKRAELKQLLYTYWRELLGLGFVLMYGIVLGIILGNDIGNVFLDMNGWLYWLYLVPFFVYVVPWQQLWPLLLSGFVFIAGKTLLFEYIFSHTFSNTHWWVYHWLRDYRLAEITEIMPTLYRFFSQDQIFLLAGLGLFVGLVFLGVKKYSWIDLIGTAVFVAGFLLSYSRSMWLGLILGGVLWLSLMVVKHKKFAAKLYMKKTIALIGVSIVLGVALVWGVVNIPYPKTQGVDLQSILLFRVDTNMQEPAANARMLLLPPLVSAIQNTWLLGSGFGTTITYMSTDPRVVSQTAGGSGEYTTHTFEWGYLDILLKVGVFGLLVYFVVLYRLVYAMVASSRDKLFAYSLLLPIVALLVTHITTPYITHPLGIGLLLLLLVVNNSYQHHAL